MSDSTTFDSDNENQNSIRIGVIGGGNMGGRLATKLVKSGYNVICSRRNDFELDDVETTTDNRYLLTHSDVIIFAVKQKDLAPLSTDIKELLNGKLLISLVAGVTLDQLYDLFDSRIIRVMTNIGYEFGSASSCYSKGIGCNANDEILTRKILVAGGECISFEENQINQFTVISGCDIGFEAQMQATKSNEYAKQIGLDQRTLEIILARNLEVVAKLVLEKGMTFEQIAKTVASKGGMTEAGIKSLKDADLSRIFETMFKTANDRGTGLAKIAEQKRVLR